MSQSLFTVIPVTLELSGLDKTMRYKVWLDCHDDCEYKTDILSMGVYSDPVQAIEFVAVIRDAKHDSWIEIIEPDTV